MHAYIFVAPIVFASPTPNNPIGPHPITGIALHIYMQSHARDLYFSNILQVMAGPWMRISSPAGFISSNA